MPVAMPKRLRVGLLAFNMILAAMLTSCGGQVTENSTAGPEATAPVMMTFISDTAGEAATPGLSKDASGFADTRMDGGDVGGIGNEGVDIVCDLTFGHAVRTGNALTSTGIEVRDLNDPLVADCANPSKCITCQNEWKSWDDVALAWVADPSHSHCVGTCTGVVPANAATELDELQVYSHFYGTVTSDMPDVSLAALLYQGWVENWPTLDFSDVLDDPGTYEAVELDVTGDFTFSFLQDPFTTHGLLTRDVIEADGWTRGIDITALDPTLAAGVGSGEIHTQHLASMPFTGAASGAVDLSAGPLSVALTLCDDVNNCLGVSGDYTVGGTISGLEGTVVLQNNGGDDLTISESGSFLFAETLANGMAYAVTVKTQPDGQICAVTNGSGSINETDVTDVAVDCQSAKKIFETANTHNGGFGGIANADAFCMADPSYPGTGTYKALIAAWNTRIACTTSSCSGGAAEHIDWVLAADTNYARGDGSGLIGTTTASGIFDFPLPNSFLGVEHSYWTGLMGDWTLANFTCESWNWNDATYGEVGSGSALDLTAISTNGSDRLHCASSAHLLCVEQ